MNLISSVQKSLRLAALTAVFGGASLMAEDVPKNTAKDIVTEVAEMYRTQGRVAALRRLDDVHRASANPKGLFNELYAPLWNEAQFRTGRTDVDWGADIYVWLQNTSIKLGLPSLTEEVTHNTYSYLTSAGRYGAARHALQPYIHGFKRYEIEFDTRAYNDKGEIYGFLPEIRKRDFVRSNSLPTDMVSVLQDIAAEEFHAGNWQQSFERLLWAEILIGKFRTLINEPDEKLLQIRQNVAFNFYRMGLYEAADAEYAKVLENEASHESYGGRSHLVASMGRLKIRILNGDKSPGIIQELEKIQKQMEANRFLVAQAKYDAMRAQALYFKKSGNPDKALALLNEMIGAETGPGVTSARIQRLRVNMDANRLDGQEKELLSVLSAYRASGRKFGESSLYAMYSDLLTKLGRFDEALTMRMEAVRLCRAFNDFVELPVQLAKLSVLLRACGDDARADQYAAEARKLASDSIRMPARIPTEVEAILGSGLKDDADRKNVAQEGDLQPLRAVAIPLAGMPLRGRTTLANPTAAFITGQVSVSGQPATLRWDAVGQRCEIALGQGELENLLNGVQVAPGTIAEFDIRAAADAGLKGNLIISWKAAGKEAQTSNWVLEPAEAGVSSAIIEGGEYLGNPFYSVPIFHHYQLASKESVRVPIRVSVDAAARIEVYDANEQPISVDTNGNGSFTDIGDSLQQDVDFDGVADIALNAGEAVIRLHVYPEKELSENGLLVTLEIEVDGKWQVAAQDRIIR